MKQQVRPALVVFTLLLLVTGVLYPLAITAVAQVVFPSKANGSLVESRHKDIGSLLIGQSFSSPCYFWGRPSSAHTASLGGLSITGSSGSNLGPLSHQLVDTVRQRARRLQLANPGKELPIPADLVSASASGLDPHISLAAAYYQVPRVARCRGMQESNLQSLVARFVEDRQLGILGEPRINVLLLNLALDGLQ